MALDIVTAESCKKLRWHRFVCSGPLRRVVAKGSREALDPLLFLSLNNYRYLMTCFLAQDEVFAWTGFPNLMHPCLCSVKRRRRLQPEWLAVRQNVKNIKGWNHELAAPFVRDSLSQKQSCIQSGSLYWLGIDLISLLEVNLTVELLNDLIALTSRPFELLTIQDPYRTSRIVDDLFSLQILRCYADAWAVSSKHGGKKVVSHGNETRINSVLRHQQPPRQASFDVTQSQSNVLVPLARREKSAGFAEMRLFSS